MSHHGIHMVPGLIPYERPLKLEPKRRLRKTSQSSDSSDAEEIDDTGAVINKGASAPVAATNTPASSTRSTNTPAALGPDIQAAGRSPQRVFNQKVMGVLLQAQEKSKRPTT
jgi:hypothetical protein